MSLQAPDVRAGQALSEVLEVMRLLFGEDIGRRAAALFADPKDFIAAPATVKARLEDLLREGREQLEPTQENVRRFFKAGVAIERLKELTRSEEEEGSSASPAGAQTLAFLQASRFALDAETYRVATIEVEQLEVSGVLHPSLALLRNPTGDAVFETVTRDVTDALRRAAESWYRPMLTAMLRLTQARLGESEPISHELGGLMWQCRKSWQVRGGPTAALSDMIRMVRNSESHRNTEIDVRAETITFVNHPRHPKPEERLGPLGRAAFGQVVADFLEHCISMRRAFAAVDLDDE